MLRLSLPCPKIAKRVILKRGLLFALLVLGAIGIGSSTAVPKRVEAVQCLPGQETCAVPGGVVCEGQCYFGKRCRANDLIPDPTCTQTTLTITNVSHGTPGSTQATITWTTNLAATHVVKYGLSASALTSQQVNTAAMSTSHSVTITSLQASTTYYYQAYSETGPEPDDRRVSSSTRSFTTSSVAPSGSGPSIIFGPRANATDTYADITLRTDVPTAALVEYDRQSDTHVDPSSPTYAQACSPSSSACPPPAVPPAGTTATDHTVRVTNFVQPSQNRKFYYRVTITDSSGNALTTTEFFFNTSGSSDDHVFTTGGCSDGTNQIPIGQCSQDGRYCRTGGQLVYDCRPGLNCTTACSSGSTCLANGDCSQDPALTGSPTECNPKFCYQKCDNNSGAKSGLPCTADNDCAIGNFVGSCVVGSFNNPAVPGCRASWPGCDANVILKVRPDRVCDKWLYCKTALETTNAFGKKENQCFDLSICDSLSPNGVCNDLLEGGQCENDPLRFCNTDADCQGLGKCRLQSDPKNIPITYKTPQDVDKIKNLSGYAFAGLDWQQFNAQPVEGYYPLSFAKQVGQKLEVQDGDFEETLTQGTCSKNGAVSCTSDAVCSNHVPEAGSCVFQVVREPLIVSLWESITPTGSTNPAVASVIVEKEGGATNPNYFLHITPTDKPGSGARSTSAMGLRPTGGAQYLLTLRLRSDQDEQPYQVSLVNEGGQETVFDEIPGDGVSSPIKLSSEWKTYRLGPETVGGGLSRLAFKTTVTGTSVSFDVDDIAFLPALQVNDTTRLSQDCRLYPREDAAKCELLDTNGVLYQGLRGYCLERDPQNSAVCLSWWPVDIISGSNIFEQDTDVGYTNRRPLYACVETESPPITLALAQAGVRRNDYFYACAGQSPCDVTLNPQVTTLNIGDIDHFKIQYAPNSAHWGKVTFGQGTCPRKLDFDPALAGLVTAKNENNQFGAGEAGYEFTVYARPEQDGDGSYIGWLRYVEESDARDSYICGGTNGSTYNPNGNYVGWPRSWLDWLAETASGDNFKLGMGVRIETNGINPDSKIVRVSIKGIDDDDGDFQPWVRVIAYPKPKCNKLVQVATTSEDSAWADRTAESSSYIVPDLMFRYATDLAPFATAVNQDNNPPNLWSQPLPLEGPSKDLPAPQYQPRSGGPFACVGSECSGRFCNADSGRKFGDVCVDSSDCIDGTNGGSCVGGGICLEYDVSTRVYKSSSSKAACTSNIRPCPAGEVCCANVNEECVGGASVNKGSQTIDNTATANSSHYAQYRLQRLFAQAFSLWQWNPTDRKYQQQNQTLWTPPEILCRSCADGKACTTNASCSSGSCVEADIHPQANANQSSDPTADYCAIKPKITQVFDTDKTSVQIDEGSPYILRFLSKVDPEQLPLTKVTIDWGDGRTPTIDLVRIKDRQSESKPHLYAHPYACQLDPSTGDCQPYQIRLQIQDNWGWCDNGVSSNPCPPETDATHPWTKGPLIQVKRN